MARKELANGRWLSNCHSERPKQFAGQFVAPQDGRRICKMWSTGAAAAGLARGARFGWRRLADRPRGTTTNRRPAASGANCELSWRRREHWNAAKSCFASSRARGAADGLHSPAGQFGRRRLAPQRAVAFVRQNGHRVARTPNKDWPRGGELASCMLLGLAPAVALLQSAGQRPHQHHQLLATCNNGPGTRT